MLRHTTALWLIVLIWIKLLHMQCCGYHKIEERFDKENITSDLQLYHIPNQLCEVVYPNNATVNMGNTLNLSQVTQEPKVRWNANESIFYTLMLISPDFPVKEWQYLAFWQCWFVGNIPGCNVSQGHVITQYQQPFSLPDTGVRRWIFLIHKQLGELDFSRETHLNSSFGIFRGLFNYSEIVDYYQLEFPVAVNYFYTSDKLGPGTTIIYP